ncbi:MAG: hypothetical protein JSS49_22510 [Planctomycetes bacterium]|nr:hypothetical protein [Planctomycetota bacterium]
MLTMTTVIQFLWNAAKGYKTYAAAAAAILVELVNLLGVIPASIAPPEKVHALAAALGALSIICLRLSHADLSAIIQQLAASPPPTLTDLQKLIEATGSTPTAAAPTAAPLDLFSQPSANPPSPPVV